MQPLARLTHRYRIKFAPSRIFPTLAFQKLFV
jgi:hypothetical protein